MSDLQSELKGNLTIDGSDDARNQRIRGLLDQFRANNLEKIQRLEAEINRRITAETNAGRTTTQFVGHHGRAITIIAALIGLGYSLDVYAAGSPDCRIRVQNTTPITDTPRLMEDDTPRLMEDDTPRILEV